MPHFYFNIRNGVAFEDEDPDGEDLPNLEAARAAAIQIARDYWEDWPHAEIGMTIEVVDEAGRTVLILPFAEAVDPHSR